MESSRIALGILLLTAYLCAQPIPRCLIGDVEDPGFHLLLELKCDNMTFTSPTDVQRECRMQALKHYIDGLKNATQCGDIDQNGKAAIDTTEKELSFCLQETKTNCNFYMTAPQPFKDFVEATESFTVKFNNYQLQD